MVTATIRSLISMLLLIATILCCSHAFAEDFDGYGLSDNEAISSLAHKHLPAALGQGQGQRSLWLRLQSGGQGGRNGRDLFACAFAWANPWAPHSRNAKLHSATYASLATGTKLWLTLGVLKI